MKLDEPKLTAYALGELDNDERRAIEVELDQSPEAREFVDETRDFAEVLSRELKAAPAATLTDGQRELVLARSGGKIVSFPWRKVAPLRARESALDVFHRRGHRVVCDHAPLFEPTLAAAEGRGAHRGTR